MMKHNTPREGNWLAGLDRWLAKQGGCFVMNIHGGLWQASGLPDRIICWRGRFVAVEAKQEGKKPGVLQAYISTRIKRAGGLHIVATSAEDVTSVLKELAQHG